MPPSLGGTSVWLRTRNPSSSSRLRVESRSRRFWKLPPESTTVRGSPASAHAWAAPAATVSEVFGDMAHERRAVAESPPVRVGLGLAGKLLELNRCLPFVAHPLAYP